MRKSVVRVLMAVVLVLLLGASARAELITIQIEAIVDSVVDNGPGTGYLNGQVSVGNTITGYYIYESTTPDQDWLWGDASPSVGSYHHFAPPAGIFLTVGGLDFQTDISNVNFVINIVNNSQSGQVDDYYGFMSYHNLSLPNGTNVSVIGWGLTDSTSNALSSDALPTTAPLLSNWQSNEFGIRRERDSQGRYFTIGAHVTSAEVIPEPATILLFGLGTLLLRKIR